MLEKLNAWLVEVIPNVMQYPEDLWEATLETIYMTFWTALIGGALGLLLGVILLVTHEGGILANKYIYKLLDILVNVFRSIPFIILIAILAKTTRDIVGTTIGAKAVLVPLVCATIPFYARQIENTLLEVNPGVVEAAQAMGVSPMGIIFKVYLKEGLPGIVRVSALTMISVIGLTAMAGVVGGGGLGNLAISRGYNRFMMDVTIVTTALMLILVFISQVISNYIVKKITH